MTLLLLLNLCPSFTFCSPVQLQSFLRFLPLRSFPSSSPVGDVADGRFPFPLCAPAPSQEHQQQVCCSPPPQQQVGAVSCWMHTGYLSLWSTISFVILWTTVIAQACVCHCARCAHCAFSLCNQQDMERILWHLCLVISICIALESLKGFKRDKSCY